MNQNYTFKYCIMDCDLYCRHKFGDVDISTKTTLHNHDGYEIVLFLGGDVSIFVESEEKKLERGDLVLFNSYAFHGITTQAKESYERITIDFRTDYIKAICDKETDLTACFRKMPPNRLNLVNLNEEAIQNYINIALQIENHLENPSYGSAILIRSLFAMLMIQVNQHVNTFTVPTYSSIMPPIVSKVFRYINDNLASALTVEELATNLHHNSDYLNRIFKQVTGCSLKQYISAKKISLAQQYLTQGYSPFDVCFMVGYNNYSTFSRQFSEQLTLSPKQFQQKYQTCYSGGLRTS